MENERIFHKFEAYLLTERRISINTLQAYRRDIGQLLEFLRVHQGNKSLQAVMAEDLKAFLASLHSSGLSATSMARKISAIKTFFGYLNQQFEWKNLSLELHIPKTEKKLPHYLSENDIKALFKIADKDMSHNAFRNKTMLFLMYATGVRVSELINIKLSDIHYDTGFISIGGKGGKQRMVPIAQPVCAMIKQYADTIIPIHVDKKRKIRNGGSGQQYLFSTQYGGKIKPMTRQAFWVIVKDLWEKTGIDRTISPHQLRHSLATHMLKRGADLRSLQMILGHENLSTVQIYTHVEKSYLRKVYDKRHPRSK
jgi:integrase/recombinase XerD